MNDTVEGVKHLRWSGQSRDIELDSDDFVAMDVALSVVPEIRLAALAVARARRTKVAYPINRISIVQGLIGDKRFAAGGHEIDARAVKRYLVPGDLPIEHDGDLANVVWVALQRCSQHQSLKQSLEAFELGLAGDPDTPREG